LSFRRAAILLAVGLVAAALVLVEGAARRGYKWGRSVGINRFGSGLYSLPFYSLRSLEVGMSADAVRKRLGPPDKVYPSGCGPKDFEADYRRPPWKVSREAWQYFRGPDLVIYVFVDQAARVEHIFVSGS